MNLARQAISLVVFLATPFAIFAATATIDKASINGATSCREWLALRDEGYGAATELWLSGLLRNLGASDVPIAINDEVLATSPAWMDDFCRRNLESTIGEAALIRHQVLKREVRRAN